LSSTIMPPKVSVMVERQRVQREHGGISIGEARIALGGAAFAEAVLDRVEVRFQAVACAP